MSGCVQLWLCWGVAKPIDTFDEALYNNGVMSGFNRTHNNQQKKTQPALQLNFLQLHQDDALIKYNSWPKQRHKAMILKGQQHRSIFWDDMIVLMLIPSKCSPINISIKISQKLISQEPLRENTLNGVKLCNV